MVGRCLKELPRSTSSTKEGPLVYHHATWRSGCLRGKESLPSHCAEWDGSDVLSATATAFGLYLIAYFAESGGEVGHCRLTTVVDDGDGLLGHRGLYLLDTLDETDVFLNLVLASGAVHLWGGGEAQGVALGLVVAFGGYTRGGQCHQGHTYILFHTVLFLL